MRHDNKLNVAIVCLAKKHHPDRGGDQQEMRRIIAAYELLMKDQT